jgi:hypothetical protein
MAGHSGFDFGTRPAQASRWTLIRGRLYGSTSYSLNARSRASSADLASTVPIFSAFLRSRYTPQRGLITSFGRFMGAKIGETFGESESAGRPRSRMAHCDNEAHQRHDHGRPDDNAEQEPVTVTQVANSVGLAPRRPARALYRKL